MSPIFNLYEIHLTMGAIIKNDILQFTGLYVETIENSIWSKNVRYCIDS